MGGECDGGSGGRSYQDSHSRALATICEASFSASSSVAIPCAVRGGVDRQPERQRADEAGNSYSWQTAKPGRVSADRPGSGKKSLTVPSSETGVNATRKSAPSLAARLDAAVVQLAGNSRSSARTAKAIRGGRRHVILFSRRNSSERGTGSDCYALRRRLVVFAVAVVRPGPRCSSLGAEYSACAQGHWSVRSSTSSGRS